MTYKRIPNKYEYDLIGFISELHANCTGASNSLSLEEIRLYYQTIKSRVANWTYPPEFCAEYDYAVLHICRTVLVEVENRFNIHRYPEYSLIFTPYQE